MKMLLTMMAVAVSLALTSGVALASSCPRVIKEGREAAAKLDKNDPKVKGALAKLDDAQGLHDSGKHAESLAKANEALADLGGKKWDALPRGPGATCASPAPSLAKFQPMSSARYPFRAIERKRQGSRHERRQF